MKGFLEWFKGKTKIKRWIFTILVGMVLICYGISQILIYKELGMPELIKIVISFVFGFTVAILGIVCLQKRTLEVLIEASDNRMNEKNNINVKSLIFNKKVYSEGPNIVVIGGGSGLNNVLKGLRKYTNNITAVVPVTNDGKYTKDIMNELNIIPMNDIKNAIISLSKDDKEMKKLLNYKFRRNRLNGLNFNELLFSAVNSNTNNFTKATETMSKILNITGKVLPVTLDEMRICAELENGMIVTNQNELTETVYSKVTKINRIYLNPSNCRTTPEVIEAIKNADCIVLGPGGLYTNVIPGLLVNGVSRTIKESKALKIYISNIMTKQGETDNYSLSDHINTILQHVGPGVIDFCVYDNGDIIPEFVKKYNKAGAELVEQDTSKVKGIQLVERNISYIEGNYIRHNPSAVAAAIIEIICDDLKFKDKESNPKYVMMNSKLKYAKKSNKVPKTKKNKKEKKIISKHLGRKSKFAEIYRDRIKSIKSTEDTIKENRKRIEEQEKQNFLNDIEDKK